MKRIVLSFIILWMTLSACQEIELQTVDPDVAVVEAYITPGNQIQVRITRQLLFETGDTTITYLNDLDVQVSDGINWYSLVNQDSGVYVHTQMQIESGAVCSLAFTYRDKEIIAETNIPAKPEDFVSSESSIEAFSFTDGVPPQMSDPIELSWSNPDADYFLIVVENIEDNPTLINDIDEDEDRPQPSFRNTPTQGDSQELNVQMFSYYGTHQIVLYKLNPEYAALYEQLSATSLDISAPPTNIENGLGIFTGINSDTLYVEVVSKK